MGFIYKITNIITNKCYIGETKKNNPYLRWNEHKRKITQGIGCPALQDAVKKYDIENFKFEILIICFDEDRFNYEIEYIKKYNSMSPNGYNLTKGGEGGGFYGKKHSNTSSKNISKALIQNYINNPELGKEITERNKILMNNLETKNKITNSVLNTNRCKMLKEQKLSFKDLKVKVSQHSMNNEFIKNYESIKQAEIETGINRKNISKMINGKVNSTGGYIWKRIN
jgi:group I intron endonuclease